LKEKDPSPGLSREKKMTIELFHKRWLLSDVPLGKVDVKLSDLATKAEIHQTLEVVEGRRVQAGKIELKIRLLQPLLKPDMRIFQQNFLRLSPESIEKLSSSFPMGAETTKPTKPTPVSSTTITPTASTIPTKQPSIQPPTQLTSKPTNQPQHPQLKTTLEKTPATKTPTPSGNEEDDNNSLDNMVSNNVLEWELDNLKKRIAKLSENKEPIPDHLITRKELIEAKLQILVIQVQTGQITVESYMNTLQNKIQEEKANAAQLLRLGKKDAARLALARMKIMVKEISENSEQETTEQQ